MRPPMVTRDSYREEHIIFSIYLSGLSIGIFTIISLGYILGKNNISDIIVPSIFMIFSYGYFLYVKDYKTNIEKRLGI